MVLQITDSVMWNQVCSQTSAGSYKEGTLKKATLQILPCTVSQLLSASEVVTDTFAFNDWELNQVSIVGVIRGVTPFRTNIRYSVDDMTGPPLNVKQWVNIEACGLTSACCGRYVKVTGNLRIISGQRSLLAMNIRHIQDPNEITSHMLEVVQAHMQLFGKMFDVNMNTTRAARSGRCNRGYPAGILPNGLSTIQGQVLNVIRKFSDHDLGISLQSLRSQLDYIMLRDIRSSLAFLINEGHIFCTMDENHFRSAAP